jgi:predicted amidohydrolase
MKIAALQMVSTPRLDDNLEAAARLVRAAAQDGARLVALPEYFCLMGHTDEAKLTIAEAGVPVGERPGASDGPIQRRLSSWARDQGVWLVGGTLPIRTNDPARVRNACCVFSPDGRLAARYDKIHLFSFDNGRERYDEGRVLEAGNQTVAFDATIDGKTWRVGLSVCFDLRFPAHFQAMMAPPCDLFIVPAAFTYTTGRVHWEMLLRARAVENQCYVLASAQGGTHENGRRTWGHSMAIDPWGEVLAHLAEEEGITAADCSRARIDGVRQGMRMADDWK